MRLKFMWWGLQRKVEWVRQLFCAHSWRTCSLQPLNGGTAYECAKCGKYYHAY